MDKPYFPPEYFYDEVRCGFYISEMMKRFWAAQIEVLYEIARICERHDLKWYIDMGSLLGTVRHQGYVPWDDDLDISMRREDWELFFKYAADELPEDFCLLSVRTEQDYNLGLGRVTNSHGIDLSDEHLRRFHGCPYCVGVDLFPMDRLYKDPKKEFERTQRAKKVANLPNIINAEGIDSVNALRTIYEIEHENNCVLHRDERINKELQLLFEQIGMECHDDDYEEVALMITWMLADWENCPKECYDKQIDLPFENIIVKASAEYDKLLSIHYRDYMTIVKGGGAHEYPIYSDQEQMLREHLGHNPYRYTFDPATFSVERKAPRLADRIGEMLGLMKEAAVYCASVAGDTDRQDELFSMLQSCQESAVAIGGMLEGKFDADGDGSGSCVEAIGRLEEYCELVFAASERWDEDTENGLNNSVDEISAAITELLESSPRSVLLIPCRDKWWDTMKPVYDKMISEADTSVYVMPIPLYDKTPYDGVGDKHDAPFFFKNMDGYVDYESYDMDKLHPDIIVTQMPFDGSSHAMTIPEQFYSDRLLSCTDELWYIPCFDADPPESENDKAVKALAVLVEQPAVMNADRIFLKDDAMKDFYVNKLSELTGETNREYWQRKISVLAG